MQSKSNAEEKGSLGKKTEFGIPMEDSGRNSGQLSIPESAKNTDLEVI